MRRKIRVSYTYTLIYHFMCSSFFSIDPSFQPDGCPFSISYSVGLLVNSLSSHSCEKFLFHPCFWRIFLLDIKFSYFSFSASQVVFIVFCLIVFHEKSAVFINVCSLYIMSPSAPQSILLSRFHLCLSAVRLWCADTWSILCLSFLESDELLRYIK